MGGLGPRGGCLHVAHVLAGGHSGRPHTFIVGLDDGRFPGAGLQDPILLDQERQALSRDLPTAGRELARRMDRLALLFARLRGNVTLSYSCHDLADDGEMFPSSVVLSAFRIVSGQRDGDQAALNRWLPPPESFCTDSAEKSLTDSEWWLWRMSGSEVIVDSHKLVAHRYPHLGRGFTIAHERESDRFTIYDGWIPDPGAEIDPTALAGPVVSASQLETLGQCPLRYFFRYVLRIASPGELTLDPEIWLDPLARGSLLHEVFEVFVSELIERGQTPDFARDEPRLIEILNDRIEHNRREIPPRATPYFGVRFASSAKPCESSYAEKKNTHAKRATGRCFSKLRLEWRLRGPRRHLIRHSRWRSAFRTAACCVLAAGSTELTRSREPTATRLRSGITRPVVRGNTGNRHGRSAKEGLCSTFCRSW